MSQAASDSPSVCTAVLLWKVGDRAEVRIAASDDVLRDIGAASVTGAATVVVLAGADTFRLRLDHNGVLVECLVDADNNLIRVCPGIGTYNYIREVGSEWCAIRNRFAPAPWFVVTVDDVAVQRI